MAAPASEAGAFVEESVELESEGLRLAGRLAYPDAGSPDTTLLLLAPHPHMGGRMDNNVIRHLARRGAECGWVTLRFDWRGVGASEIALPPGESLYDHFAAMERERRYQELLPDARAALGTLREAAGVQGRCVVVGYSLGAVLAGMLAPGTDATHVVGVSPPAARVSLEAYRDVAAAKLFLAGDADFAFDAERFRRDFERMPEPRRFVPLPGADHFHRQEEERVFACIRGWLGAAG